MKKNLLLILTIIAGLFIFSDCITQNRFMEKLVPLVFPPQSDPTITSFPEEYKTSLQATMSPETAIPIPSFTPDAKKMPVEVPYNETHWKHIPLKGSALDKIGDLNTVYSIAFASEKEAWAGTSYGLWKIDEEKTTNFTAYDILSYPVVNLVKVAPNGKIWWSYKFKFENKISSWDGKGERKDYSLNCKIRDYTFTSNGVLWMVCSGISYFKDDTWQNIKISEDGNIYSISSITAEDDNSLWVTSDESIFHIKNEKQSRYSWDWLKSCDERGLYEFKLTIGPDNTLWGIAGSTIFHQNEKDWENYCISYPNGQSLGNVAISQDGTIWAGNGFRRDEINYIFSKLPFYAIFDVKVAPDGSIWYGTQDGIYIYDHKE